MWAVEVLFWLQCEGLRKRTILSQRFSLRKPKNPVQTVKRTNTGTWSCENQGYLLSHDTTLHNVHIYTQMHEEKGLLLVSRRDHLIILITFGCSPPWLASCVPADNSLITILIHTTTNTRVYRLHLHLTLSGQVCSPWCWKSNVHSLTIPQGTMAAT